MSEEESEQPQRRRSARIIALEERKEKEKKALAAARKNNPVNNNNGSTSGINKSKGKAIVVEHEYDFIDDDSDNDEDDDDDEDDGDEQYAPTKKRGRKSRPLNQLISSTQAMQGGQNTEIRSTSKRNGSPKIPDKHVLEFVLDLLQRKDPDELFAEPVNPDEGYYRIVKQPMDFATMRAKLHENMYTDIEQFKRDVYLICSNAMNVNPASTMYHKVAEAINEHATKVFHGLSADPENFHMEFNLNKKRRGRKPGRPRNSGRPRPLPPKLEERSCGANSMEAELERRHMYWPSSGNSLLSEVMNAPKQNLQFTKPASNYQDSLVQFVQDMGPAAQTVAARKLERLRFNQILCGETPGPNPLANFLDTAANTTTTLEPTSEEPTQPSHDTAGLYKTHYPLSIRPLTIPGRAPQESRNVTNNFNFDNSSYKGKMVCADEGWDAYAAALLGGIFVNYDKGAVAGASYGGGFSLKGEGESSSYKPPIDDKMSSLLTGSSSHQNQLLQLGGPSSSAHQWNTPAGTSNLIDNFIKGTSTARDVRPRDESSRVRSQVWPTRVISGPQSKPITTLEKQLSQLSRLAQPRATPDYSLSGYNISAQSLLPHQQKPEEQPMTDYNLSRQSLNLWSQIKPADQPIITDYDFSGKSLLSQQKPVEPVTGYNLSWQSLMSQLKPEEPPTSSNLLGQSLLSQQKLTEPMTGCNFWQSFMSQPKPEEPMTSSNLFRQSILSQQKPTELMTGSFKCQPKPAEVEPMTSYTLPGQSLLSQSQVKFGEPITDYTLSGSFPQQKPLEPMTAYNLPNQSFLSQPKPSEPMTGYNFSGDFQAILGSTNMNNILSFPEHANLYTPPPPIYGFSDDFPMQHEPGPEPEPSLLNPLGLFPQQEPKPPSSSSAALEMPIGHDAMNYYEGTAMESQRAGGVEATPTAQLLWDDDHHPNLALQL